MVNGHGHGIYVLNKNKSEKQSFLDPALTVTVKVCFHFLERHKEK
jgi:hypothetical protein